ncbi:hypothetical protein LJC04_05395 [Ruminococcaceae bacterium OttesenSCG-928-O06]|nr:hypothetical protein [Ruminococcaceae bacterium OttesenSCG-928-O06]
MPNRKDLIRLINKARKYGDTLTAIALEELYDDVLYTPPAGKAIIIPPRAKIETELAVIMAAAHKQLIEMRKSSKRTAGG